LTLRAGKNSVDPIHRFPVCRNSNLKMAGE
jgi:hypothetical protein